jgi:hypothetical protein
MAYSNSWNNATPADPVTVTIAPAANDVLIGGACTDASTGDMTWPAGFTEQDQDSRNFDGQLSGVGYKGQATGSETSVVIDVTANSAIAAVASFSGRDNAAPLSATPVKAFNNTGTALTGGGATLDASITPAHDGCDIVAVVCWDTNASVDVVTSLSTVSGTTGAWTVRQDIQSGFRNMAIASCTQVTAGAITARATGTAGSGSAARALFLFALKPAAGGGGGDAVPHVWMQYRARRAH